jgi:hypothetical protein
MFKKEFTEPHSPPYENRIAHKAPPQRFQIFFFFPRRRSLFFTSPPPVPMPVKLDKKAGPWQLEAVKLRLRAEQVARENAAALRYRQLEDEAEQPLRRTHATDRHTGKTSWLECFLCALVVCCVLLVVAVVFLCVFVVLSLTKKEE